MAEYFPARIAIPKVFLERKEVQELVEQEEFEEEFEESGVVDFYNSFAYYGQFEKLERELQKLKIPYDRYTSAYSDQYLGRQVYFRPDETDPDRQVMEVPTDGGQPIVYAEKLWTVLKSENPKQELTKILAEADPLVVPLTYWGELPYQELLSKEEFAMEDEKGSFVARILQCHMCEKYVRLDNDLPVDKVLCSMCGAEYQIVAYVYPLNYVRSCVDS